MSRFYSCEVFVEGADQKKVAAIIEDCQGLKEDFSWRVGEVIIGGDTHLCGGESEEEAHDRIAKAIKKAFPKAKVRTKWTYMEDLPYNEYGDKF